MSDDTRAHLLGFIGHAPGQLVQAGSGIGPGELAAPLPGVWDAAWHVAAAHAVELSRAEVIDDRGFAAVARALIASREGAAGERGARAITGALDAMIDSRMPSDVSGAATLGLAREEWLATVARLLWRDVVHRILEGAFAVRDAVLVLAETHVVTIMPAFLGGQPGQPTTLAHFVGPLIGSLQTATGRLELAGATVSRSPMGAGMLAGDVLAADRSELAQRLGFGGTVPNTLDALGNVEDVVAVVDAISAVVAPLGRFVKEIRTWIRTDPMSFVLDEGWSSPAEPGHPAFVLAERLDALDLAILEVEGRLDVLRRELRSLGYGPLGMAWDRVIAAAPEVDSTAGRVLAESKVLFETGLVVNRAYLGNRAGRGHTTAPDLATFLMVEEQVPPAAARRIAVLVLAQLKQMSLEVSGITPDMIDSAALMTIGREIKVEMETLGRFLAPRRYIERRHVTGSPAPAQVRTWLAEERSRLSEERGRLESSLHVVATALAMLESTISDAAAESPDD